MVILYSQQVARIICEHCLQFQYDMETGEPIIGRDGKPEPRWAACPPACRLPVDEHGRSQCPKGTPEEPLTLNREMQQCYDHYRECRAVGSFPDDPMVRQSAALIREIEDGYERHRQSEFQSVLMSMMLRGAAR